MDLPDEERRIEFWCDGPDEAVLVVALERVRRVELPVAFMLPYDGCCCTML